MKLRDALILQSPTLELQRAAHCEIARLDDRVAQLEADLKNAREVVRIAARLLDGHGASALVRAAANHGLEIPT